MNLAEALHRLGVLRAERQRLANHRPPFAASLAAQGCGPAWGDEPLTPAQQLYDTEYRQYRDGRLAQWRAAVAAVDAEIDSIIGKGAVTRGDATVVSPVSPANTEEGTAP